MQGNDDGGDGTAGLNDNKMAKMSTPTPGHRWAKPLAGNIVVVLTITLPCRQFRDPHPTDEKTEAKCH